MIIPLFIIGSLMHFLYNWVKHEKTIAIFAAVNESYWEHLKMAFWPAISLYTIEYALGGYKLASFIPAKTIALYLIVITILGLVFLYRIFSKKNILFLDIGIFLLAIIASQYVGAELINQITPSNEIIVISFAFILLLVFGFIRFTHFPPRGSDIFLDPITKRYGIKGHK